MTAFTISWMRPRKPFTMRGVKALFTRERYVRCLGGSMLSMIDCTKGRSSGGGSRISVPFRADEKSIGFLEILRTSACFVIAQKPGPSGSSCQKTGASRRNSRNMSWGTPC
jgi:hypothetical protein